MTATDFQNRTNVSRETFCRLEIHAALLARWQGAINLVGKRTLADPWRRHMLDSAQLLALIPEDATGLVDLGSGAGFPGLVLAIMGVRHVELIEAQGRKCQFLREVARATATAVTVTEARIEKIPPRRAAVVTARACAPLDRLLPHVSRHLAPGGRALLLKGNRVQAELTKAAKDWTMTLDRHASSSDPAGVILEIRDLERVDRT